MNRGRSDRALQDFGRGNEAYRGLSDKSDLNWVRRLRQVEMFSLISQTKREPPGIRIPTTQYEGPLAGPHVIEVDPSCFRSQIPPPALKLAP
jgi:hypothetical protein